MLPAAWVSTRVLCTSSCASSASRLACWALITSSVASDGSLFSQLYRGEENNRAFFDRIVANLSILGGGDIA